MLYLKRIDHRDKTTFGNYHKLLNRKGATDELRTTSNELNSYFKKIEWLLKSGVTYKIAQGKARLEIQKSLNKQVLEEGGPNVSAMGRLRDTTDTRLARLGRQRSSVGGEKSASFGNYEIDGKNHAHSLFRVVQTNPKSFKSASISVSRKKMRKLAGLEMNEPLDIDELNFSQRQNFEKVLADRYTSDEIKGVYDICLNYKRKFDHPGRNNANLRLTKEMLFKSIEQFEQKKSHPSRDKPDFMLRRHKSSSSLRPE